MSKPYVFTPHLVARCPWCNGHDLTTDITEHTFQVRCFDCGATGPWSMKDLAEAVVKWNTGAEYGKDSLVASLWREGSAGSNRNNLKKVDL